jgi:septal ring factor EnvC (AmiA/AmiB activator)
MRKLVLSLTSLAILAVLSPTARSSGKTAFDDVVKQMIETMDSLTTTLATIRDEETAKAAVPELRKSAEKWQLVKKKAADLQPPSREEKDRLAKDYKKKLEEAQKKLFAEVGRVSLVPGGRPALMEISSVLDKKKKE